MKKLWVLKKVLSYLELEGQGRGIIMEVTRPLLLGPFYLVKWSVNPNILAASVVHWLFVWAEQDTYKLITIFCFPFMWLTTYRNINTRNINHLNINSKSVNIIDTNDRKSISVSILVHTLEIQMWRYNSLCTRWIRWTRLPWGPRHPLSYFSTIHWSICNYKWWRVEGGI